MKITAHYFVKNDTNKQYSTQLKLFTKQIWYGFLFIKLVNICTSTNCTAINELNYYRI